MQIPTLKLKPPPPYGDLRELETTFATLIPVLTPQLASLLGKRTPKSSKKDARALKRRLHRFLLTSRPYLLGLQALRQGPDHHKCSYALLEGLLKEHFRAVGKRISDNQDAFQVLLKETERTVRSPRTIASRFPAYSVTKKAVYELLLSLYQRLNPLEINQQLEEWYASKSCKKYLHSCLIWPTLIRKSRQSKPARLTLRLADQLSEEYRMGCSLMEDRLRLLVWLDEIAKGTGRPWIEQESRNLFQLLEAATISSRLTWVPPLIDRHVRNALAHGQPELNLDAAECRFHDRTASVTWSMNEFFEKTKQLTLAMRALMELEPLMQMLQTQSLVTTLWQQASGIIRNPWNGHMIWSIGDVEKTLLGQSASVSALPPDEVVAAVNRVENVLGHDWILAERATGIAPAMGIIGMGLRLAALDDLANTETLVSNLRQKDQNAEAELTALCLIRGRNSSLELELEPAVGTRKADFRVRKVGQSLWTTVEVTQATTSEYQQHLLDILHKILDALKESKSQFSLDVIFRREPREAEITSLRSELPPFCVQSGQQQVTLPDELGFMLLNHTPISQGQRIEMAGVGPTIGIMMFVGGGPGGGPNHKVSVQIPFTDERAEEILRKEAKQLPKDGIGLVMINASGGAGRFQPWASLISKRLQPKIHTRVSGVCLFEGSMVPNGPQYDWLVQTKLVVNDHAGFQLPSWIQATIKEAGEQFEQALLNKAG